MHRRTSVHSSLLHSAECHAADVDPPPPFPSLFPSPSPRNANSRCFPAHQMLEIKHAFKAFDFERGEGLDFRRIQVNAAA